MSDSKTKRAGDWITELRQQALRRLGDDISSEELTESELRAAIQELQIHQVELELQNEELQRTQQVAQRARAELFDLFNFAPVGYAVVDETGMIVKANVTFGDMVGQLPEKLEKTPFSRWITEPDRKAFLSRFNSIYRKPERKQISCSLQTAGHKELPVLIVAQSQSLSGDAERRLLLTITDVTERKEMESQLAQADRLSSMGLLAAGIAHELNNPLTFTLNNLEILAEDLPPIFDSAQALVTISAERDQAAAAESVARPVPAPCTQAEIDGLRECLGEALEGARRIRGVAKNLGAFSRVERQQAEPIDLTESIESALRIASNELRFRARLVKEFQEVPEVLAAVGRMSQVFLNLLLNAIHAIDKGNIEDNEVRIRTGFDGDSVWVEVRDTGCGIAPEHLEQLFEPFFSTKAAGEGSGLGLSISRTIVEGYGGSIAITSKQGSGTTVTISLPPLTHVSSRSPVEDQQEDVQTPRGRILIIDDESGVRRTLVHMLREHETVQAETGNRAKQILSDDQRFDVILCDMMMLDISGEEVHDWIEVTHPELTTRVLFMTGGAVTPRTREFLSTRESSTIHKPFNTSDVQRLVNQRVRETRQR